MATEQSGQVSGQWNWVNVSHPRELKHAANITTIRRRAMLAVHRIKRSKVERGRRTQSRSRTTRTFERAPSVRSWEDSEQEAFPHSFGDGETSSNSVRGVRTSIDKALCHAAILDYPEQTYLLNHWTFVMTRHLLPICTNQNPMCNTWVQHAFSDTLLMNALLFHAAVHLDAVHQRPPSRLTSHYGIEATKQLSSRLDCRERYLCDTSIAAVVMLLANQMVTSNFMEMQMHLDALESMIRTRGGIETLGMDGVLQMSIKWLDINTALFQNTRPRFVNTAPPSRLADLMKDNFSDASLSSFELQDFEQGDITTALFHLRQEILDLTEIQARLMACPSRTSTAEAMEFAARRTSIENVLLLVGQGFATTHAPGQDARLREACCIAGSIYVHYLFRGVQNKPNMTLKALKRRLVTCVERFELEDRGSSDEVPASVAVFFWALNVAGTMALDLEEKTWLMVRLSRAAKRLHLMSLSQVSASLDRFLWNVKLENQAWRSIWADLEVFMGPG